MVTEALPSKHTVFPGGADEQKLQGDYGAKPVLSSSFSLKAQCTPRMGISSMETCHELPIRFHHDFRVFIVNLGFRL